MLVIAITGLASFALGLFIGALLIQTDEAKKQLAREEQRSAQLATQFAEVYDLSKQQANFIEQQCADIEEMRTMLDMREARRN